MKSSWNLLREALADTPDDVSSSPFGNFLMQKFPEGEIPWPWVQKILEKHGVPMPLHGENAEEAAQLGITMGSPASVTAVFQYLGY